MKEAQDEIWFLMGFLTNPPAQFWFLVVKPQNVIFAYPDRKIIAVDPWLLVYNESYIFHMFEETQNKMIPKIKKIWEA